jgi:polyhydroxyalkanoate synthesis repressor PhaR
MAAAGSGDGVVIIKKYANRRLYDTESSSYITLERLAEMVRQKREFKVVDAKSGDDITHAVLTQIIMDEEARGTTMLPVNFLRQLIGMYGDRMQSAVPQYLEASLDAFQRNQNQLRDTLAGAFTAGPFAESPAQPGAVPSGGNPAPAPPAMRPDGRAERLEGSPAAEGGARRTAGQGRQLACRSSDRSLTLAAACCCTCVRRPAAPPAPAESVTVVHAGPLDRPGQRRAALTL